VVGWVIFGLSAYAMIVVGNNHAADVQAYNDLLKYTDLAFKGILTGGGLIGLASIGKK